MKAKKFILSSKRDIEKVTSALLDIECNGTVEVLIRNASTGKTMRQLGLLFGIWETVIANSLAEDKNTVHERLKSMFLERIYTVNPINPEQEMWVSLRFFYQERENHSELTNHRKRISLGWANLKQMRMFMDDIQTFCIGNDIYLPSKEDLAKIADHDVLSEDLNHA